jgi:hypothetical protein
VYVAVDQARKQHLVLGQGDRVPRYVLERGDGRDSSTPGVHGSGTLTVRQHHPSGADDEVPAGGAASREQQRFLFVR